jgi:hypothetical protein
VFLGFKENGLTTIDIPEKKEEEVKLQELQDADKSTQE